MLPEIAGAQYKSRSHHMQKGGKLLDGESTAKKVEYVHEEFYDNNNSTNKWTIFNKHALEIENESD